MPRRLRFFAAMSCLTVLLALTAAELSLRTWLSYGAKEATRLALRLPTEIPVAQRRFRRHHYLNICLNPGYRSAGTTHNRLGFRGPEFPVQKPAGEFRIVVLGGSTTYTYFVEKDGETFPAQLEQFLRQDGRGRGCRVINGGVPTYNSWECLIQLAFRVLDLSPDLVIIYLGTNDIHARLVSADHYRADNSGLRKPYRWPSYSWLCRESMLWRYLAWRQGTTFPSHIEYAITSETAHLDKKPALTPFGPAMSLLDRNGPFFFENNMRSMVAVAKARGVQCLLSTFASSRHFDDYAATPHYRRAYKEMNEVVAGLARELDQPCFDFATVMPEDPSYWHDGRHVNRQGAREKARLFARFILGRLSLEASS